METVTHTSAAPVCTLRNIRRLILVRTRTRSPLWGKWKWREVGADVAWHHPAHGRNPCRHCSRCDDIMRAHRVLGRSAIPFCMIVESVGCLGHKSGQCFHWDFPSLQRTQTYSHIHLHTLHLTRLPIYTLALALRGSPACVTRKA